MARIREIEAVQQSLAQLEAHIRGMSVPTQDRIWWRFRQEQPLLMQLLNFDLRLVRSSEQIFGFVSQLIPEEWNSQSSSQLREMIQQLTRLAQGREQFLLLQV